MLGFSQIVAEANWNAANTESIRKAAREAGIELRLEDAHRSQENQVAALRSFVSQRVDVIAFSPVVETGWEAVLREIRSAGIPVILMDRTIEVSDDSLYVSLIGSDFVEEGRRAGRWLLEHTRDVPGEIDIVELQGTVGSAPANDRKQGFAEVIAADRALPHHPLAERRLRPRPGARSHGGVPAGRGPPHPRAVRAQRYHGAGRHRGHRSRGIQTRQRHPGDFDRRQPQGARGHRRRQTQRDAWSAVHCWDRSSWPWSRISPPANRFPGA